MTRFEPVPSDLYGQRFDVAVSRMLGLSRSQAAGLIGGGRAVVHGRALAKSGHLEPGDIVEFSLEESVPESQEASARPVSTKMSIAYEDDDVVVVDKPAGVAAHQAAGWQGPTVLDTLLSRGIHITSEGGEGRQGIVSRLDVGTSGLMLVCKSDFAYPRMRDQFAAHEVIKTYHALVQGNLSADHATIEAPIGRSRISDFRFTVTQGGKRAVTHYDVLKRFGEATLVRVNLETGRTHQIRVHFSSIGHPLVGDPMYGGNPVLARALRLRRQWLHSMKLEFRHPRTGVWTAVESKYCDDLRCALDVMEDRRRH
ncbi:RluA family pseudouridine synthase [Bifidobacterium bombi]|uniref:Pseudouridine synthase n=1 Tax=Bifidobacterium bombi DSM 19703 TaxID=1341695 RepID=A0A086BNR9_9BIFI|nr:RluA family pseudouridine synthase [Bifidobacterium bombi]KFF30583.1 pseudouridine synthase, RluA family [Bifidobacterium bombi DSM 19703]